MLNTIDKKSKRDSLLLLKENKKNYSYCKCFGGLCIAVNHYAELKTEKRDQLKLIEKYKEEIRKNEKNYAINDIEKFIVEKILLRLLNEAIDEFKK